MTGSADGVSGISKRVDDLDAQLRELIASVARVEGAVATQTALLEAGNARSRDEISKLFEMHEKDVSRIHVIEIDYVPRKEFAAHRDENERHHTDIMRTQAEMAAKLDKVSTRVAVFGAVVSFVGFIVGLLVDVGKVWLTR